MQRIVPIDAEHGNIVWKDTFFGASNVFFAPYDAEGNVGEATILYGATLTDCNPIAVDGDLIWYETKSSKPVFYRGNTSGLEIIRVP